MSETYNLTNQEQLWIMEKVKQRQLSVEEAEKMASVMSSGKEEKMESTSAKAFTFGVIRYPYGFKNGNGIKNSMQIDFRMQSIYFMDKITIHVIIPFIDIIECFSDENNFGIKIQTKHSKFKFTTNSEHKAEIERLLSTIIQGNKFGSIQTELPSFPEEIPSTPDFQASDSEPSIISLINKRKVLKEGILEKKGNAAIVRWSKRFLRVEEREFSYYEPNKEGDPLGVVQINSSTEIEAISTEKDTFVITVGKRSYFFRVKKYETPERTEGERNSWLLAFREACSQETFIRYWVKNRKSFFPSERKQLMRSSSPPVDYDTYDGNKPSQLNLPAELEMITFRKPSSPTKVTSSFDSVPQKSGPKTAGPQNELNVPEKKSKSHSGSNLSSPHKPSLSPVHPKSPSTSPLSPNSKSLSFPSQVPSRIAPPPPVPPPPPVAPSLSGLAHKSKIILKAHCDRRLKHFYVPNITPKEMCKTVWGDLTDITARLDMNLLEENFTEEKKISEPFNKETKRISYMSPKKAQNILILMRSDLFIQTVYNLEEVINSLKPPEDDKIDTIQKIQKYQPAKDEIELYQKLIQDKTSFQKADKIMALLSSIPCLQKRLELILNVWTFESQYEEFIEFLKQLMNACSEILNSKKFPKVLEYLLAIFNLMNTSGSASNCGAIQGFHLKFLSQLKSIHNASGFSLLKMLVCQLNKSSPELLDFHKEFSTVMKCENISVKAIHANIEVLKKDLKSISNNLKSIESMIEKPTAKEKEFFFDLKDFYKIQQQKLDSTVKDMNKIQKSYEKILTWFGLPRDTSSEELFQYLISFIEQYIATMSSN